MKEQEGSNKRGRGRLQERRRKATREQEGGNERGGGCTEGSIIPHLHSVGLFFVLLSLLQQALEQRFLRHSPSMRTVQAV